MQAAKLRDISSRYKQEQRVLAAAIVELVLNIKLIQLYRENLLECSDF